MTDPLDLIGDETNRFGDKKRNLTRTGLILEAGLVVIALGLSWLGVYDHEQKLVEISTRQWQMPVIVGLIGVVPMIAFLLAVDHMNFYFAREIRSIADKLLTPLFSGISIWKILIISVSAGIGEELLFRWCLQGGIRELFSSQWLGIGVSIFLASIFFGICHWLNLTYAIYAFAIGIYFGVMMELTDSVIAPIVCHAAYDFLALTYIVYFRKPRKESTIEEEESFDSD